MNIKFSLEYRDYHITIDDDGNKIDVIITSFNKPSMKAFKGEKVIIIRDEDEHNKHLN